MQQDYDISHLASPRLERQVLLIMGMHRSGSSATSGALRCLGVHLGKRLYAGHQGINAKGYFEHSDIADANEEATLALGSCWDDILLKEEGWWRNEALAPYAKKIARYIHRDFSGNRLWALKDPRICRLLPWWLQILAGESLRPCFLFVIRSPAAVHRSLQLRDGFSKEKSALLWLLHYLDAELWSRGHPRAFVDFDRLLEAPVEEFIRVEREVGLAFPVSPTKAASCLDEFLSGDLRHHTNAADVGGGPVVNLAVDLHKLLQQKAVNGEGADDASELDALRHRLATIQDAYSGPLAEHLSAMGERHGQARLFVGRVMRSWSWYAGKPIRFFERLFGRDV